KVVEPHSGILACGETGQGRMAEPEQIFSEIVAALSDTKEVTANQEHILITSGGTREPVDGVRSITNFSSGQTGAVLADHLVAEGFKVTFLFAKGSKTPEALVNKIEFETYAELSNQLKTLLSTNSFHAVL